MSAGKLLKAVELALIAMRKTFGGTDAEFDDTALVMFMRNQLAAGATDDGGPAFPIREWDGVHGEYKNEGLTMRDYFAAKAMQAMFAGQGARQVADRDQRYDETNWAQVVASNAYEMADAMLVERKP